MSDRAALVLERWREVLGYIGGREPEALSTDELKHCIDRLLPFVAENSEDDWREVGRVVGERACAAMRQYIEDWKLGKN